MKFLLKIINKYMNMRKLFPVLLYCCIVFLIIESANAQQGIPKLQPITATHVKPCGLDNHLEEQVKKNPQFINEFVKKRQQASSKVNQKQINCTTGNSIVIPIAVHFNDPFTTENMDCLKEASQLQIAALNKAYGAVETNNVYYDLNTACAADYPTSILGAGGACIQFCLATQNHPASSGLADGEPAITVGQNVWTGSGNTDAPAWPGYLNIFVSSPSTAGLATGVLGIAALPGNADGDGFWVHPFAFGNVSENKEITESSTNWFTLSIVTCFQ